MLVREGSRSAACAGFVAPMGVRPGRWLAAAAVVLLAFAPGSVAYGFGLDDVAVRARELSQKPFDDQAGRVPDWLLEISYDQWRDVRFRPDRALWKESGSSFQVQFFHPGLFYNRVVDMNVVDRQGVRRIEFSPSQFDYGNTDFASRVPQDLGYAGFRIHYPIKTREYHDEVIVFLGASYFRAVGREHVFGASARGLAVNTALSSGEEFPYFREFWLERPSPGATEMRVYALLDSASLTGAYEFVVRPGEYTMVEVDSRLFRRKVAEKLGIAPLTSMFFIGENSTCRFADFRPEVHDSDGLLLSFDTGEWLWHPLDNPERLRVGSFKMQNPRGFGLLQRDRDFDHYQDLEARQDLRPSVWIAPRGNWGTGRVELIEIPTRNDANDNIVAFWVPEEVPSDLATPLAFAYTMSWHSDDATRPPGGRVLGTRRDRGTKEDAHRFVVDFAGKRLKAIPADRVLRGVVSVAPGGDESGKLLEQHVLKNPVDGSWRLVFQLRPEGDEPLELRAFLDQGGDTLTETWSFTLVP